MAKGSRLLRTHAFLVRFAEIWGGARELQHALWRSAFAPRMRTAVSSGHREGAKALPPNVAASTRPPS